MSNLLQKFNFPTDVLLDSLLTKKGLELVFWVVAFVKLLDKIFFCNMTEIGQMSLTDCLLLKLFSETYFFVLSLGIWCRHEIWISNILKCDFLEKEKNFWKKIKNILPGLLCYFLMCYYKCYYLNLKNKLAKM